jgi:hypothetical protein
MRTVKTAQGRHGWRAASLAGAALIGPALVVGCGSASGTLSGGTGGQHPSPTLATQARTSSPAARTVAKADAAGGSGADTANGEQTLKVWGDDGCLEYLVLDSAGQTVAVSATDLCRIQVSTFAYSQLAGSGTFYAYFARGNGLADWQAVGGQGDDGYTYWEYNDQELYRWPASGNAAQLTMNYSDGLVRFEDLSAYLQQNPAGLPIEQTVNEGLVAQAMAKEEIGSPPQRNPELPDTESTEYAQAQQGISAADGQARQSGQAYQGATQDNAATDQPEVMLLQAQQKMNTIFFAQDCQDSDNVMDGCGGASAYNDDGGVGEGLDD